jgi:hypothetical protein
MRILNKKFEGLEEGIFSKNLLRYVFKEIKPAAQPQKIFGILRKRIHDYYFKALLQQKRCQVMLSEGFVKF